MEKRLLGCGCAEQETIRLKCEPIAITLMGQYEINSLIISLFYLFIYLVLLMVHIKTDKLKLN